MLSSQLEKDPHTTLNRISESLVLLNLVSLTPTENTRLKFLISEIHSIEDWQSWLVLAKLNACESLIFLNLKNFEIQIPEDILESLRLTFEKIASENKLRNQEAETIFKTFQDRNISFIILKGQALADDLYGSFAYKKMNDVDFIVRKSDLDSLQILYRDLQLQCAASLGGNNYRKQEQYSHHWPPFFTKTLNCVLGTHWNIVTPLSDIHISETQLWSHTVPHSFLGIPCFRLDDLYFFFHLVVHLAYYKTGLKEFSDPLNWYRLKKDNIEYHAFLNLVLETKAFDPVYRNLYFLNKLCPDQNLNRWIQDIKPYVSAFVIEDTQFRCRELYFLVRSRSTQTSRIEKSYALFSLSDIFYEKFFFLIKMWQHFLFPKKQEVIRMQSLADKPTLFCAIIGYIKSPYLLSRVFAFDLGWSLHFILIAKHHLDLVKSVMRFLLSLCTLGFVSPFPKSLKEKIKSLNLPIDSIEQIKTKLE